MSDDYPLYPTLAPEAAQQAQLLMDGFKVKMHKLCDEVLGDLYCDVAAYIETDQWTNFRNELFAGFSNYGNRRIQAAYDFAKIRRAIFEQFREEIVKDLNQDLVEEVAELKKRIEDERKWRER
jgi:hypothetical protein